MSGMGERSREGQRVPPKSQVGFQAASAAVAVCSGLISPDTSIGGKYNYRGVMNDRQT
jgi:hypothetical protein